MRSGFAFESKRSSSILERMSGRVVKRSAEPMPDEVSCGDGERIALLALASRNQQYTVGVAA
jgi:hypothetical protein